jgi:hypothetical protein
MTGIPKHFEDRAFQAAVDWAVSQLLNAKAVAPELFEADGVEKVDDLEAGLQALMGDVSGLIMRSRTDWRAYRALELACARYVRNAWDLPAWASEWIADHLEGKLARPPRPRGPSSKAGLHQVICECLEELIAAGMVGVRNDATDRRSACDVLAEALRFVGQQPSTFEGVKRVFVDWNKRQDEIERKLRATL